MQKYPHNGVGDATARYADDVNDLKPHLNTANHALIAAAVDNRRLGSSSATALSHAPGGKPSFDDDNDDEEESMMNANAYHNHHHNSQMNHHHRGSSSSGNKYLVDKQPMMNNNHLAQRPGYHGGPHQDHESSGEEDEDDYKYEDEGNDAPERRRESNYSSYEAGMIGHNRYYSNSSESYLNSAAGTPLDPAAYANQQMAKKPRGELTCVVCGAAANGYNFDAITCESCKAFFRRNAFRPLNLFRCSNNNACEITIVTRKKCKKCRIMKCFNLGMRRDWIMTEVEREEKRRKIAMNKTIPGVKDGPMSSMGMHHEGGSSQCSTPTHPYAPGAYGGPSSQYNSDGEYSQHQGSINDGEGGQKPIRRRRRRRRQGGPASGGPTSILDSHPDSVSPHIPTSSYNSMHPTSAYSNNTNYPMSSVDQTAYMPPSQTPYYNNMDEVMAKRKKRSPGLDGSSLDDSTTALSTTATSSEEATTSAVAAGKSLGLLEQYKNVNRDKIVISDEVELKARVTDLERKQIEAIQVAYKQAIQLVKAQGIPKTSEDLNTTINLTELGVRRLIFFFKLISDFRNLDHDLMVKLLKRNMMNLIQIHGVNSYNRKEDIFKEPDSDDAPFSASSLESIYGPDIYKLTIGITQNLYDLCDGDMTYIKILLLIVIFDPMNDTLSDEERLQIVRLQNKYVTLLHAFLCDSFGKDKGAITFKSLLYEMNKVNDLAQWFERVVAEKSNYEYVRPLMKEVFSLPTQSASGMNTASASTPEASTPPASVSMASSVAAPSSNLPTTG